MEALTEEVTRSDVEAEMMMLTPDDGAEKNVDNVSDEVENLRNSLREVVHDEGVQPKMQCLMMDTSFSMVTMQGEDSGIAWETTPSPCTPPWLSEALPSDRSSPALPATPGSRPAGKIVFVMDEEMISRRRKPKESVKSKGEKHLKEELFDDVSGRPELVEVSQPNVKSEEDEDREDGTSPQEDEEQSLFSIVSEGSEILNIVVPSKFATVDEEESKDMVDNLSYLAESLVPKASEETQDELQISTGLGEQTVDQSRSSLPRGPGAMDPPGAPVPRPPGRGAGGNVDYFDAFCLIEPEAPGGPAVIADGREPAETEAPAEIRDIENTVQSEHHTVTEQPHHVKSDTASSEEITSELLDEVFYGNTDSCPVKSLDTGNQAAGARGLSRLCSKPSGSSLFSSQEDILTPVFLPEGPPKIIDPILLEEPKAMAFLYSDLYEEALGSWKKEEDTESMTSEKSFHSRHSDREARGYLEKFVLIDETPVAEAEQPAKERCAEEDERILPQDLLDFEDILAKPNKEEELTDFFRDGANSSPCDIEPLCRAVEDEDTQTTTKTEIKIQKSVSIVEKPKETPVDSLGFSSFDFSPDELDWEALEDNHPNLNETCFSGQKDEGQTSEIHKPDVAATKTAATSFKTCLDLTPLTPADEVTPGCKEQRAEEKETASPAETADEADGEGEEPVQIEPEATFLESAQTELEAVSQEGQNATESKEEKAPENTEAQTVEEEQNPSGTPVEKPNVEADMMSERQEEISTSVSSEPPKGKGHCVIL